MDRSTVFTKTAKGITQVNQKSASLSKDLMKVLKVIDGKVEVISEGDWKLFNAVPGPGGADL